MTGFTDEHSIEIVLLAKFRFRSGVYKTVRVMSVSEITTSVYYLLNAVSKNQSASVSFRATDEIMQVEYIVSMEDTGLDSDEVTTAAVNYRDLTIDVQIRGTTSNG